MTARPSKEIKSKSSAMLVARSEELLKSLLEKYGSTTTRDDIFKGLLKAKLSEKFRRMQRKHRQKALAVASAMYHIISRKPNPPAALHTLVKRMNVSPPRGSDPCRMIVECLFDYGSTPEERTHNRQYACADANALRYIIRKGIEPQKVLAPERRGIDHELGETRGSISQAENGVRYSLQSAGGQALNNVGIGRRETSSEASV